MFLRPPPLHAHCKVMVDLTRLVKGSGGIIWDGVAALTGAQPAILSNKRAVISFSYRIYQLMLPA